MAKEQAEAVRDRLRTAWALFDDGRLDGARALYTACLAQISEEAHEDYGHALMGLVYVEAFAGNYALARRYAQELLARHQGPEEEHIFLHAIKKEPFGCSGEPEGLAPFVIREETGAWGGSPIVPMREALEKSSLEAKQGRMGRVKKLHECILLPPPAEKTLGIPSPDPGQGTRGGAFRRLPL